MKPLIPVEIGCPCEGAPHDSDTVNLVPDVSVQMGWAALGVLNESDLRTVGELGGVLAPIYLHFGIATWSLVDAKGKPLEVTRANIDERLTWGFAATIIPVASELYAGQLTAPLVQRQLKSLKAGQTAGSTSPIPLSGHKRPKPSKRSLQNGSDGMPSGVRAS